jgi:lipopolysaccharide/colanic/teichoic acid biosynthesis glycosyltransferase
MIDVSAAAAALVVLAPVLLATALCVRASLGSPVLFRQVRAGRGGVGFVLLKFRTMRAAASGAWDPSRDASRLTPFGARLRRWSLDELPQFVNVLRGDMSLVGPRPLPMQYVARYSSSQAVRLEVLPGITGWAQVNGRNATSWEDRFELDRWYVEHRSIQLDLRILFLTVRSVVSGAGVSGGGSATMTEFLGT